MKLLYPNLNLVRKFLGLDENILDNIIKNILGDEVGKHNVKEQYGVIGLNGFDEPLIGIDIPVMVQAKSEPEPEQKKVIAFVAQDPLRNNNDVMLPKVQAGNAIVGTPFALHYQEECYPQTAVYRRIIDKFIGHYNVYITDARKIYPNPKKNGLKQEEINLLGKELELESIKPILIVTFGSDAKEYVSKVKDYKGKVLNLLHPSQQNWDHWKQWIFEQAFYEYENVSSKNGLYTEYAQKIPQRKMMFDSQAPTNPSMPEIIAKIIDKLIDEQLNNDPLIIS